MTAPIVWVFIPGVLAFLLVAVSRWRRVVTVAASASAALLAVLAIYLPIGGSVTLGPLSFEMGDALLFFGRRLILNQADRPILVLIFGSIALWLLGAYISQAPHWFPALSLAMGALLTAAISVEPFLFAAMLIEMAVLLCVVILPVPGRTSPQGILRFLTYFTLGMPFILFAGWMLSAGEADSGIGELSVRAAVLLATGFVFLLGIFPFSTWLPGLMEDAHPYTAAFVIYILSLAVLLFGVGFFQRYSWLRQSQSIYQGLQIAGLLMITIGGSFAAFQRHLGRILGYAVMVEIGYSLLAASLGPVGGWELFFGLFLPRCLALIIWALSLAILSQRYTDLRFRTIQGASRHMPLVSIGVITAHFCLLGFPLLPGFPVQLSLWLLLSEQNANVVGLLLVGVLGLFVVGLRSIAVLVMGVESDRQGLEETLPQRIFLGMGLLAFLFTGFVPSAWLPALLAIAQTIGDLVR